MELQAKVFKKQKTPQVILVCSQGLRITTLGPGYDFCSQAKANKAKFLK